MTAAWWVGAIAALVCIAAGRADAKQKELKDLPKDALNLAFVWTEPLKQIAEQSKRFDPVSGLWFGLLRGSVKSVERTAAVLIPQDEDEAGAEFEGSKALLKYHF